MLKIILADDERSIRVGLRTVIEKNAADCIVVGEAMNGREVLDLVKQVEADVLITDIKMPLMDGIELIKEIMESDLKIRVIALSGFEEYKYVRDAMKYGAIDYLLKPVDKKALFELLKSIEDEIEMEIKKEQQIQLLSKKVSESLSILKEKFLLDLIQGRLEKEECRQRCIELDLDLSGPFILLVIGIDDTSKLEKRAWEKLFSAACNYIRREMMRIDASELPGRYTIVAEYKDSLIMLSSVPGEKPGELEKELYSNIEQIKAEIGKEMKTTFTAGISYGFDELTRIHIAYHQAMFALQRRFYEGKDKLIRYSPEKSVYENEAEGVIAEDVAELENCFELDLPEKVKKAMADLFRHLKGQNVHPLRFREILANMVAGVLGSQQEARVMVENLSPGSFELLHHIKKLDTLDELECYLTAAFYDIAQQVKVERSYRSRKIIEHAKDFINRHYSEDITLKAVAEYVHLNPNYFSNLFKKETGKNFIDFLIQARMQAAKKLLSRPEVKVYEVGVLVGYEDAASFNRVFRKVVGVAPSEYKKLVN